MSTSRPATSPWPAASWPLFPEHLTEEQRIGDALAELGELATTPEANIIKLPNVSASMPQLKAAIAELQGQGFALPDYPDDPQTDEERDVRARYDKVKGSAVNPVLREGNSDRRAPAAVKNYARKHPHSMGAWSADSRTNVATMGIDDFRANEQSVVLAGDDTLTIRHVAADGTTTVLKDGLTVLEGEVVDATVMRAAALDAFLREQIARAKADDVLFSVHLKATMMKVCDPIVFGHVVRAFLPEVFETYGADLAAAGLSPNNGLGGILDGLSALPNGAEIRAAIDQRPRRRPAPGDGQLRQGHHQPARAERRHRRRLDAGDDPHVRPHVGPGRRGARHPRGHPRQLLRRRLPGRHRRLPRQRRLRPDDDGLGAQRRADGPEGRGVRQPRQDLRDRRRPAASRSSTPPARCSWRTTSSPATSGGPARPRTPRSATGSSSPSPAPAPRRPRRSSGSTTAVPTTATSSPRSRPTSPDHDTEGLDLRVLSPVEAATLSVERIRRGEDTISVTGNVLRDYNTDLFPILELGTSAKMLSVVPLMNGGGLFETGAGGSAPKHVQQLVQENYLRWDSLGEFLALAESFRHEADERQRPRRRARRGARPRDRAAAQREQVPGPPGRPDRQPRQPLLARPLLGRRSSPQQTDDAELAAIVRPGGRAARRAGVEAIDAELIAVQGSPVDIGGYYRPDAEKAAAVMRPSATFNGILASLA